MLVKMTNMVNGEFGQPKEISKKIIVIEMMFSSYLFASSSVISSQLTFFSAINTII